MELTFETLKNNIEISDLKMIYSENLRTVKITHEDYDVICEINQWLIDTFPIYMPNIAYGLENGDGKSWLDIVCIDKVVRTTTLKLTDSEIVLLDELTENNFRGLYEEEMHILFSSNRLNIKLTPNEILVQDVDKFREFLKDSWDFWGGNNDNIKSIVSKLDKEVK